MTLVAGSNDATVPGLDGEAMTHGEASFAASVREAFFREVYGRIYRHAVVSLDEALDLAEELNANLMMLQMTLENLAGPGAEASSGAGSMLVVSPVAAAATPSPAASFNGAGHAAPPTLSKLTARQKSRVRELGLLETLNRAGEASNGPALHKAITDLGVADGTSQGAMVSQLHRMAEQGYVSAHGNGMYEITSAGLQRERDLRKTYGAYLKAS